MEFDDELHDENDTEKPQLIARIQSRLYDAEPDAELYAEPCSNDCAEATISRIQSYGQSKSRIKPEPRYQHVTVTESKQSTVVKLEPSTGPTLFLNRTTADRSTTVTAIRIQYCTSCTTRTDTAARKDLYKGSSIILENKNRETAKQYTKRHCKRSYTGHS